MSPVTHVTYYGAIPDMGVTCGAAIGDTHVTLTRFLDLKTEGERSNLAAGLYQSAAISISSSTAGAGDITWANSPG